MTLMADKMVISKQFCTVTQIRKHKLKLKAPHPAYVNNPARQTDFIFIIALGLISSQFHIYNSKCGVIKQNESEVGNDMLLVLEIYLYINTM